MKSSLITGALLLALFGTLSAQPCWEACSTTAPSNGFLMYRDLWDSILEIMFEIRALKSIYDIDRIVFLIDSAMSNRHDVTEDPNTNQLESGESIFQLQILLVQAIALFSDSPSYYVIQYNEKEAWTCSGFNCIDACETVDALSQQIPIAMGPSSHCPGNIESACRLAHDVLLEQTCLDSNQNAMVIAIANGDFYYNGHRRGRHGVRVFEDSLELDMCPPYGWDGSSSVSSSSSADHSLSSSSESNEFDTPCRTFFHTRYAIGTHEPTREVMESFVTKHAAYRYFHDTTFALAGLEALTGCVVGDCCTGQTTAATSCVKTQGPFGDHIIPYSDHPAL